MIVITAKPHAQHRPPPPEADARPLYIAPGAETHVCLDGPALCVQRGELAEQLFPLRRLSRIHCSDGARWSTEALLACARLSIGVIFVDEEGEVVARVLGHPGGIDNLSHRLWDFLLLPQALDRYEHWVHAEVVRLFESKASRAAFHGREITGGLHRWLIHET